MNVQTCVKCVMDSTDPDIYFDDAGVCNYCNEAKIKLPQYHYSSDDEAKNLQALKQRIKTRQKGEYDSILGLSGGVDSSYVAYLAMQMGLNPLCVHFDNGWNSDIAVKNIRNIMVGITGTKYKPLDNSFQIKEVLKKMVDLINKKELFFEKAFLGLILISYIQAFEDGNKRTARMLSNAILLAHNSIPLSYRIVDIEEYKKASLLFYEINNISYFKQIFIEQFEDAVNNYFN